MFLPSPRSSRRPCAVLRAWPDSVTAHPVFAASFACLREAWPSRDITRVPVYGPLHLVLPPGETRVAASSNSTTCRPTGGPASHVTTKSGCCLVARAATDRSTHPWPPDRSTWRRGADKKPDSGRSLRAALLQPFPPLPRISLRVLGLGFFRLGILAFLHRRVLCAAVAASLLTCE